MLSPTHNGAKRALGLKGLLNKQTSSLISTFEILDRLCHSRLWPKHRTIGSLVDHFIAFLNVFFAALSPLVKRCVRPFRFTSDTFLKQQLKKMSVFLYFTGETKLTLWQMLYNKCIFSMRPIIRISKRALMMLRFNDLWGLLSTNLHHPFISTESI